MGPSSFRCQVQAGAKANRKDVDHTLPLLGRRLFTNPARRADAAVADY